MSSNEDDWQLCLGTGQFALQVESALARKPHVKHQTRGSFRPIGREKFAHRTVQAFAPESPPLQAAFLVSPAPPDRRQ